MDAKAMLEDLLANTRVAAEKGRSIAEDKLGVPESGETRDAMLSGMGKGALAAGALALLLGTSGGRKLTGTAVKVGGLAALGGLAYKAYNQWQQKNDAPSGGAPIGELASPEAGKRSELLVRAMISAAKADGHIDQQERQNLQRQIDNMGLDEESARFLMAEIDSPIDPAVLAREVSTPEEAAELYLASAMVIDVDRPDERLYLNELAAALELAPDLTEALEYQLANA